MDSVEVNIRQFGLKIDGKFNPAILNHDFLLKIEAIPYDSEPPETTAIPVMTSLDYEKLGFTLAVDLDSFLISQKDPAQIKQAFVLAERYMAALEHTPVERLSFNFIGEILFDDLEGMSRFESWLLRDKTSLVENLETSSLLFTIQLNYKFLEFDAAARLGAIDPERTNMPFLLWYDKEITSSKDVQLMLNDEEVISKITEGPYLQLGHLCAEGKSHE